MFKLPNIPSSQAGIHEKADFAEILCWEKGRVSEREIIAALGRESENDNNIGCDDADDDNANNLDEVMNEIERRALACGKGYPFILKREGTVLHFEKTALKVTPSIIYLYLLLSTRLNMQNSRIHSRIDGTLLLESLSAHVLKNYLGSTRAKSLVFGTAMQGSFKEKIEHLCCCIGEGGGFDNSVSISTHAKDDKLDTVAWIPFKDFLSGQLIVFGQCKTGTDWHDSITQLHPLNFTKKWMKKTFLVDPLRVFCVSEAADRARWKEFCIDGGILFDRCRLVDLSDGIAGDIEGNIRKWTLAAQKSGLFKRSENGILKKAGKARRPVKGVRALRKKA